MRRAKWRQQPATESQKKIVESRWNKAPKYAGGEGAQETTRSLRIQRLTKGEAANIITRIKHGAMVSTTSGECSVNGANLLPSQSRYQRKMAAMRKEEQLQLKEIKRRAREVVAVGPLAAH